MISYTLPQILYALDCETMRSSQMYEMTFTFIYTAFFLMNVQRLVIQTRSRLISNYSFHFRVIIRKRLLGEIDLSKDGKVYSLAPARCDCILNSDFKTNAEKYIVCISCETGLRWMPQDPANEWSTLFLVMAEWAPSGRKSLTKPLLTTSRPSCFITRPQCANT